MVYASQAPSGKFPTIFELIVNATNVNYRSTYPPFILTFDNFNYNVHNSLVDSGSFANFMPLFVANKINVKWEKADAKIIQLNRYLVLKIGELNNVIICLSSYHIVHQSIDIVILDIFETMMAYF